MTHPAVSEHITKAALLLVFEVLPGRCPDWRLRQIYHEVTTAVGATNDRALIHDLERALRLRGKHEYEIEAIEDVLIAFYRKRTQS